MKILVGISGGADSAYTAYKLKQMGHTVEGIVLEMHDYTDISSAKKCADILGIKLHTLDCRKFKQTAQNVIIFSWRPFAGAFSCCKCQFAKNICTIIQAIKIYTYMWEACCQFFRKCQQFIQIIWLWYGIIIYIFDDGIWCHTFDTKKDDIFYSCCYVCFVHLICDYWNAE